MATIPEEVFDADSGIPEEYEPEGYRSPILDWLDDGNIADKAEKGAASDIKTLYDEALASMDKWLKKYKRALALAKLQAMSGETEITEKSFPFEGASIVMMPYILEAALDFNSRAAPELVWTDSIVHGKIWGENNKEKDERVKRVSEYSNYQLKEIIPDWQENQDKGIMVLPITGTYYKKTYFDFDIQDVCSDLLLADEVVFNHNYKTFSKAPDKFVPCKYTRNEVIGYIRGKQEWLMDVDELDKDQREFSFVEAYIWLDLDDDDLEEPYIAVIWEEKEKIVALYPHFDEDTITYNDKDEIVKIERVDCFTQYQFIPDPEGGPMGMGWGILLGPMFDAINTNMRQLLDSGTLANTAANSGLISQSMASGRGNTVQSGPIDIAIGELTPVPNHGTGNLRDNVVQFPFAGPSTVLFQLLEYLIASARQMTNAAVNVEANAGEAASLYLSRLQQGLKVPNSIIMRVYRAAKDEFSKIAALNYSHFDDNKYNKVLDSEQQASMEQDFNPDDCDIRIVADPTQGSDIERIQRAQAVHDLAVNQPQQVINYRESLIQLLKAMKTPDIDTLAPEPDPNAVDPMQQMLAMQQAAEMELRKQDQMLRAQEVNLKKQKLAMEAAKEMAALGLQADKQEAEITSLYAKSLESLFKAGMATGQDGLNLIEQIENQFIGDQSEGRTSGTQVPPDIPSPDGNMASQPGNGGLPPMP